MSTRERLRNTRTYLGAGPEPEDPLAPLDSMRLPSTVLYSVVVGTAFGVASYWFNRHYSVSSAVVAGAVFGLIMGGFRCLYPRWSKRSEGRYRTRVRRAQAAERARGDSEDR